MTARASNWSQPKFIDGAIHVLQAEGYLTKGMTTPATNQNGATVTWRLAGKGEATEMSPAIEERPTLNADRTTVTATMKDYEANEWINVMDLQKMSEAEIQVAQKTVGYALGRRYDKTLFEALDAANLTATQIGNGTAAISILDAMNGQASLLAQGISGVPKIWVALPYGLMAQLMLFREFANSDYIGDDLPLRKQLGAKSWLGMNFVPFPDSYFNVPAANQIDGYMWLQPSVGFATPTDAEGKIREATRVDYVPTKKAHYVASTMSACSTVLMTEGVRRLRFATNVALSRPNP